jgi:glyoxylase-like metal-dependent hydrolase (beta-lactamase superfamily II)
MAMFLESRAVAPFFKNGFVLACPETRKAALVDPGDEVGELLGIVRHERLTVEHILLTHAHVDHVNGIAPARAATGAPIWLHEADQFLYDRAHEMGRMFGMRFDPLPPVDRYYAPDTVVVIGRFEVRPHHTPGHCPGGVCLEVRPAGSVPPGKRLFVGDTLFAGSIGRTDLPGGDYPTLIRSITTVLFAFGDDAVVYPGHGPETTIGDERRTNPFLQ